MLLYLTNTDKVNLLDFVEPQIGMPPKKMVGKFSLLQFVIRDMRNYTHINYFVVDRDAASEDDDSLVEAVKSFKMMFDARIIMICEGYREHDMLLRQLIAAGVTDIVTATDIDGIHSEILECLSAEGMQRYRYPEPERSAVRLNTGSRTAAEDRQYRFSAVNVRIAVAGCQRRSGVTTTAANLAHWIVAHGGTACYVEANEHQHLKYIAALYNDTKMECSPGETKDVPVEHSSHTPSDCEGFHVSGVDYYFADIQGKNYNFIVSDYGILNENTLEDFSNADLPMLCAPAMPYELPHLHTAMTLCDGLEVAVLGMYVPSDIKALVKQASGGIAGNLHFMEPAHELFSGHTNGATYHQMLKQYISRVAPKRGMSA